MSGLAGQFRNRMALFEQSQKVLDRLKVAGVKVADAIDTTPGLSQSDKESLAVVLGGVAYMSEAIELSLAAGEELAGRDLLDRACAAVDEIDQVLSRPSAA
jgi:hypothetical protein